MRALRAGARRFREGKCGGARLWLSAGLYMSALGLVARGGFS